MKTVVFGASGYLGSHTAEQLTLAGHDVLCVLRETSDSGFLETLPVEIARKDFNDIDALAEVIDAGCTVYNCVAETRMHLSDDQRRRGEIYLTARIFRAAQKAKAKRFVQLSTVMAYGFDRPPEPIDESFPPRPKYSYSRIACEREQLLMELVDGSDMELIILRPSNTLGKRDSSALPAMLQAHEKGNFAVIDGGEWRYSCMDARDVGRAMVHLHGIDVGDPEIFLVKGYDTSWLEVKEAMDEILDRKTKLVNIPKRAAMMIAWFMEVLYPKGKNPPLTRFSVEVLSTHTLFDDSKIRNTGFESRYDLMETLSDALDRPLPK